MSFKMIFNIEEQKTSVIIPKKEKHKKKQNSRQYSLLVNVFFIILILFKCAKGFSDKDIDRDPTPKKDIMKNKYWG